MNSVRVCVTLEIDPKDFASKLRELITKAGISMESLANSINASEIKGMCLIWTSFLLERAFTMADELPSLEHGCWSQLPDDLAGDIERVVHALNKSGIEVSIQDLI